MLKNKFEQLKFDRTGQINKNPTTKFVVFGIQFLITRRDHYFMQCKPYYTILVPLLNEKNTIEPLNI